MKYSKAKILFFVFSGFFTFCFAQNSERSFVELKKSSSFIEIKTNDGVYKITPYSEKIIQTTFIPNGESEIKTSHAVVMQPKNIAFQISENENTIFLKTQCISVKVLKNPFQIQYYYKNKPLIAEGLGYFKTEKHEIIDFQITESEILYGGGARALGMNRRYNKLELYNRAHYGYETRSELMNYTLPLVFSSNMYAIHFDNAPIGFLDLDSNKNNTLQYQTIGGRKTYQVIASDTWADLVNEYTNLTGKQPLIPLWALGNFSSRFGYHSQQETENTIDKFIENKIPVDAVILDLYWFGKEVKGTMGNLEFDKDSFPNPKKMIDNLAEKGVKTILITEPFILTTSNRWQEAVDEDILGKNAKGEPFTYDFYFGNTGLIDIFSDKGKSWFWNIYKNLTNLGVAGWWGDLGEPEVHPSDLIHQTGTADEVHNIYGHYWAKLIFDGYKKYFPNQRPFILMRAGYSGSQHYGLIPWSGDVNRTWGGLQSQTEIALQMGIQGLGYMHSDLGGFAGANLDDELYVRWLQYGVFQPIYRPHAQEDVPSEPVFRSNEAKLLAKKAIELRYQLLPYNYTLAFENSQKGTPLMRPLFFEEPQNKIAAVNSKTYLWGNNFLVSPVVESGIIEQEVYFPKSANWFDFYTDEKVEGGSTKKVRLNKNSIPTYVRAGAFIPLIKPIQNTELYDLTNFETHFYFDDTLSNSSDYLYHDDGKTPNAYEKGMFEMVNFFSKNKKGKLTINIESIIGKNYVGNSKNITLIIHNFTHNPKKIKGYKFDWDNNTKRLRISVNLKNNSRKSLIIKY
jgi:alpha-glucosidase (family GH31 glycosyl hydrolase)